ncbi:SIR2 family NAD-dependent protein deacylase [Leptospira borgpetersenii]|uniref:SIR2 family NAD-dependent protein deacylase n=1 Tax=Leptospira borgpetersenii TaxID=174 RepID=UPI000297C048|nr:SIR2 family protein [Leptospira borgpetersenii]AXX15084.1 SIR2 family protein [Leptospira borgpetersenii serovar Ceylonica]EKQ92441.1 SIR2-like domain protein [Leptospira borgpetersenii str. UI 09149]EMN58134.1 SIR2-like domain protein [Leptospira borgpetersenii serovar Javanica str. MK146]MDQ7243906.1 SIR2 family protein [Leptospira borgpetersenii]QVK48129.1 SIR2 family protein [Leptospira borgpetersenii]
MLNNHDPVRHLEYIRQSLSQDKKPIGFFIASGCPLAVDLPPDKWPLIPDIKNLTVWLNNELKNDKKYKALLQELIKAGKSPENVEDILSFIRGLLEVSKGESVRGFNESDLAELEKSICNLIVKKIDVLLPDTETPYHKLVKWISSIDREVPIEIFTTNYDILMEQALEKLEVPYFDGFVGARRPFFDLRSVADRLIPSHWTRIWKIHGSINWYQEIVNGQRIIYRSSEIKNDAAHLIYPSHLKYEESKKMPYLALIEQLNMFIRQKSSLLIIVGYSFGDEHLNDTIVNALKSNPTAMVLSLMYNTYLDNSKERYAKAYKIALDRHNLNVWTFDKAIIGTNLGSWIQKKAAPEPSLNNYISQTKVKDDPEEYETWIKLGDFSIFSDFLKTLIGEEFEYKDEK